MSGPDQQPSHIWYRKTQSKKGATAAQQVPTTQAYLASAKAGRVGVLSVNFAFDAWDATVPQLHTHTEVSGASQLQLLMNRAWPKMGTTFPPGLQQPGQLPGCYTGTFWPKMGWEHFKQMSCHQRSGLVMNDPLYSNNTSQLCFK